MVLLEPCSVNSPLPLTFRDQGDAENPPEVLILARELVQFCYSKAAEGLLTPVASYFG